MEVSGIANVLATAFGKAEGTEWFATLFPESEAKASEEARRKRDEILRAKAMMMRMEMMKDRYEITVVRER